jgi:colanic acid biosynthesis glycosyl transferase WcaI
MARVLILSIVAEPDRVSTATIVSELARRLAAIGHDVELLSSTPHYNPVPSTVRPRRLWTTSEEAGVRVTRCATPSKGGRQVGRRLASLTVLHALVLYDLIAHRRDREVLIVVSPPLTFAFLAFVHRRLRGSRVIYNAQELWPDVPRDLGVIKSARVLDLLERAERYVYRSVDWNVPIGTRFGRTVVARGANEQRLTVIPNFADPGTITPTTKDNHLAREWGLHDRPVVLYAGNVGLTQDFPLLLAAAERLPDVEFLIVGDGAARETVAADIRRRALANAQLRPFVSSDRVRELYGLADIVIVPLHAAHSLTTTPSKIFAAMAAARPIVATSPPDTDLAETIVDACAGLVITPGDLDGVVDAIRRIIEGAAPEWDPQIATRAAASHTPAATARAYDAVLRAVTTSVERRPDRSRPERG